MTHNIVDQLIHLAFGQVELVDDETRRSVALQIHWHKRCFDDDDDARLSTEQSDVVARWRRKRDGSLVDGVEVDADGFWWWSRFCFRTLCLGGIGTLGISGGCL